MKPTQLSDEEVAIVTNPEAGDLILLEVIKGMSLEEMKGFDVYSPIYKQHYADIQLTWLNTEMNLLYNRPCNNQREVPEDLLLEDIKVCNNAERFRVFYVLKYPAMVQRIYGR